MVYPKSATILACTLQLLTLINGWQSISSPSCKASLGSSDWPRPSEWAALNRSLSGRLLQPPPPGGACHLGEPNYNAAACPALQTAWSSIFFHQADPVSSAWNNWNNDSCLPYAVAPCSGRGYPVYVVNATCPKDVKTGVDFARKHNLRLNVKGTGHDYLGRSTSPNSLSIWTHYMTGITFSDNFKPKGCSYSLGTPAFTAAAGTQMYALNLAASLKNLTTISGGALTLGIGGYLTGGGHGALTNTYGLAADNVLEMEMVTPGGEILTVNECRNQDLFWAMRGGGGSTFGVLISATIKAFPQAPIVFVQGGGATVAGLENSDTYWNSMAYIMSQFPSVAEQGIMSYSTFLPNTTLNGTVYNATFNGSLYGAYQGLFILPILSPSNSSTSVIDVLAPIWENITLTYPNQFSFSFSATTYPSFYEWWIAFNGPNYAGVDFIVGSHLLDIPSLTANVSALKEAMKTFTPPGGTSMANMVSGKGVWNARPRGGSDAVNPAWRKSLVQYSTGVSWTALNETQKLEMEYLLTNVYDEALRKLAPETGAYINEADPNEPNFQEAFWGANYPRLLAIKRAVDPWDVLWCTPCVGNERWHEVGGQLCRV